MTNMAGQSKSGGSLRDRRQSRLADKLRQNLVKRKEKTRAVRAAEASDASANRGDAPREGAKESKP